MTLPPLAALSERAVRLLQTEGLRGLLRHTVSYAGFLAGRVFMYRRLYLYQYELIPRDEKAFLPRLDAWDVRRINSAG